MTTRDVGPIPKNPDLKRAVILAAPKAWFSLRYYKEWDAFRNTFGPIAAVLEIVLASGPAAARRVVVFKAPLNAAEAIARTRDLFAVMEQQLQKAPFLTGGEPNLADIANYTYAAHAPEGNVSLAPYPRLRAWLGRIEALPGFVPMATTAVGLAT